MGCNATTGSISCHCSCREIEEGGKCQLPTGQLTGWIRCAKWSYSVQGAQVKVGYHQTDKSAPSDALYDEEEKKMHAVRNKRRVSCIAREGRNRYASSKAEEQPQKCVMSQCLQILK